MVHRHPEAAGRAHEPDWGMDYGGDGSSLVGHGSLAEGRPEHLQEPGRVVDGWQHRRIQCTRCKRHNRHLHCNGPGEDSTFFLACNDLC